MSRKEETKPMEAFEGIILPKGVKIYPIVKYGAEILERPSAKITKFDDDLRQLCADMFITMYAASGVGLAAPQIGMGIRLSVIDRGRQKILGEPGETGEAGQASLL